MVAFTQDQLNNIQGIGLVGFRKDHQQFIFVTFPDQASGTALIAKLADRVASAWEVGTFNALFSEIRQRYGKEGVIEATWIGLAISGAGFQTLGVNLDTELPAGEGTNAFKQGMAARSLVIGDTHAKDAPVQWKIEFRPPNRVDAVILVASDDRDDLDSTLATLSDLISEVGCQIAATLPGGTLPDQLRGHEHFGTKDGISQPAIDGFGDPPAAGEPQPVMPGEFILGYQDELGQTASVGDLWIDGSFMVYRLLLQNVAAYNQQLAKGVDGANPPVAGALLGAKLAGRWPSGAPLELNPDSDPGPGNESNAFVYKAAPFNDDEGLKTPRFAHVRKAFPRDETTPDPNNDNPQRHRMIRRGIPFGQPLPTGASDDGAERGLHFVSFVADVARQFELVQSNWLNNPNFPNGQVAGQNQPYGPPAPGTPADGPDPLVGEHDNGAEDALHQPGAIHAFGILTELVTVSGGEYFFAPAIAALKRLASGVKASTTQTPTST